MEALIRPEFGLMFWTIFIFSLLLLILSKTAWRPLMKSVEERERSLRHDREGAEKARADAELIKAELDARLAAFRTEADRRFAEAAAEGNRERVLIIDEAHRATALMLESAKKEIEVRKDELVQELKHRVAELVFMAAEKVLLKTIDQKANKELVDRFIKELESKDARLKLEN